MTAEAEKSEGSASDWHSFCADAIARLETLELSEDLQIPSLPTALTEFLDASARRDFDIRKLGQIVEHDPGMTVDLLKCVNSAANSGYQPVRTPTEALIRLGVPRARKYLIAAGMRGATLAHQSRLMNHRNFWNESLRRALFAQNAARNFSTDLDLAFIGGLLQDFLLPVLTNRYDDQYIQFLKDEAPKGTELHTWEQDTFGWDHASAGAYIAHKWNLPNDLLCAILLHHQMDVPLQASDPRLFSLFPVTLAALLPDQLSQVPNGVRKLLDADQKATIFRLDELCLTVDEELEKIAEGHDTPLCLAPVIQQARELVAAAAG